MQILCFDELDSTNSYLKREYPSLKDMTVVVASHQNAGKGRLGRKWEDDSSSLLFSILLRDSLDMEHAPLLSLLSGVCLHESLKDCSIDSEIKWPNDVLIQGKKCAGILLESVVSDKPEALIVGIGVNLNNEGFQGELEDKAASLFLASGRKYDRMEFLKVFLRHFRRRYGQFRKKDFSFLSVLKEHSYLDGKEILLDYYGENLKCRVVSVLDDGRLEVIDRNGRIHDVDSGEASLCRNYSNSF